MDPLLIDLDLRLAAIYYPAGFRLEIATNSKDVLEAAEESWGHYRPEFPCDPVRFDVIVGPEGDLAQAPTHRARGHLYSVVSDAHNFAHLDLKSLFGAIHISQKTASDHVWLRWFYVESLAYTLLSQRYIVPVHAACVERNGAGVLLCGPSGAGKSTLSFACARAGWTFVSDDCTWLLPDTDSRTGMGRPRHARFRPDAPGLFPELEGYVARARPNGKVSIEIPVTELPGITIADRCSIGRVMFLDRRPGKGQTEHICAEEALDLLLAQMPSYGAEVNAMHKRTVARLTEAPAYRLRYESLDDALRILSEIIRK